MLGRLLALASISAVLWLIGKKLKSLDTESESLPTLKQQGEIVRCVHCGLHIPEQEAIRNGDEIFCCEDHKRATLSNR